MMYGTVVTVEVRQAATQLVGAHASGVSVLNVASVDELAESGQVTVAGSTLAYTAVTSTEDPDGTAATDTIVLSAATTVAFPDGELVARSPKRQEKVAFVVPTGSTVPVEARVKHSLADRIAEGSSGQVVYLIQRPNELGFVVDDIHGRAPMVDLSYAMPGTLTGTALGSSVAPMLSGSFDTAGAAAAAQANSHAYADALFATSGSGNVDGGDWATTPAPGIDGGTW